MVQRLGKALNYSRNWVWGKGIVVSGGGGQFKYHMFDTWYEPL
jgi:hypothetical protein